MELTEKFWKAKFLYHEGKLTGLSKTYLRSDGVTIEIREFSNYSYAVVYSMDLDFAPVTIFGRNYVYYPVD